MFEEKESIYLYNYTDFYDYFYLNTVSFASLEPKVLRNVSVFIVQLQITQNMACELWRCGLWPE